MEPTIREAETPPKARAGKALQEAIEGLYSTFAVYPLRPSIEGCNHCISPEDHARIHSRPLRELTADDLEEYSYSAMNTWGNEDDLRHFLPRLLELIAFNTSYLCPPVVVLKLHDAGWRTWPQEEQAAIEAYLSALWAFALECFPYADPDGWTAEECLCTIAQVVDDLGPFLDHWRRSESRAALCHLALLIYENAALLPEDPMSLNNGFWDERQPQMDQVTEWLLDPSTGVMLEQAKQQSPEWISELEQASQEYSVWPSEEECQLAIARLEQEWKIRSSFRR